MTTKKKQGTWVQCAHCGEVYHINMRVPIDELYVECYCPKCKEYTKAINCGDNENDISVFYDPYLDERYYTY